MPAGAGFSLLADAAREVALRIDVHEQDTPVRSASEAARLMAVVVFPTPPFWFATATILPIRCLYRVLTGILGIYWSFDRKSPGLRLRKGRRIREPTWQVNVFV